MNPKSFRGRKNARRVNALAEKQQQITAAEERIKELTKAPKNSLPQAEDHELGYLQNKLIRLQKNASNLVGKIMEQGAAEAVRTKKNRQGFQRSR